MTSTEPWKPQRIGNLRERITFTAPGEEIGRNPYNEPIYGPDINMTVYARAEPIKGDELLAAGQVSAYHEITFHCRFIAGIKATWEIMWRGNTYNITGWRNLDERRRFIAIEAKASE